MNFALGRSVILSASFSDPVTGNPADPPGVSFTLTDPTGLVTSALWRGPGAGTWSGAGAANASRLSAGAFQYVSVPTFAGMPWRWAFLSTSTSTPTEFAGAFGIVDTSVYPYPFGYCDITDVQARIQAGSWTPTKTAAWPNTQQVSDAILQGAASIDTVLARTGYTVPITPKAGQIIQASAWQTLLEINACLGTAYVERTRHGSQDMQEDQSAAYWLVLADDKLARIEAGDDNLSQFGIDGPFYPQPDKSVGMQFTGGVDAYGNDQPPLFTIGMRMV